MCSGDDQSRKPACVNTNSRKRYIQTYKYIRFLFKDSQILCYKKFVKNSTDLLVS